MINISMTYNVKLGSTLRNRKMINLQAYSVSHARMVMSLNLKKLFLMMR